MIQLLGWCVMQFYQYWLILIIILLVIISLYNIVKMIIFVTKNKYPKIDKDDSLNRHLRNMLVSIGLLSVIVLVYVLLIFKQFS